MSVEVIFSSRQLSVTDHRHYGKHVHEHYDRIADSLDMTESNINSIA